MLGKLFDPARKLSDERVEVRRTYLETLSASKASRLQDELLSAFEREESAQVRGLILKHLDTVEPLAPLLDGDETVAAQLAEHIAQLDNPDNLPANIATHPNVLVARMLNGAQGDEAVRIAEQIDDVSVLVEIATRATGHIQELVLDQPPMRNSAALQQLEQTSRNRNKSANRLARDRLETIRTLTAATEELATRIEHLAETATRTYTDYESGASTPVVAAQQLAHLRALEAENRNLRVEHAGTATKLLEQTTVSPPALIADPFLRMNLAAPSTSPFRRLLDEREAAGQSLAELEAQRATLTEDWRQLSQHEQASESEQQAFEAHLGELDALAAVFRRADDLQVAEAPTLPEKVPPADTANTTWQAVEAARQWARNAAKALKSVDWPAQLTKPEKLVALEQSVSETKRLIALLEDEAEQLAKQAAQHIDDSDQAITDGKTKQARKTLTDVRTLLSRLPKGSARPLEKRTNGLYARLGDLQDWQQFATSPKRNELVQRVCALEADGGDLERRADRLKQLRTEWRDLGAPSNKEEWELQRQFDEAAEKAFEPCRVHFQNLRQTREDNLTGRENLVAELSAYLEGTDWQTADYRAAETILRTARKEWHALFPTPRGKGKALTKQFESLQDRLHKQLEEEWQRNVEQRQALIERVKTLRESAPLDEQIEGVKAIQVEWKATGTVPRHQDQKLWRAFRAECDAVFTARSDANAERSQALAANLSAARTLSADFAKTLEGGDATAATAAQYRESFQQLGELPREGRAERARHRELLDQFADQEKVRRGEQAAQRLIDLLTEDTRISRLEASGEPFSSEYAEFDQRAPVESIEETLREIVLLAEIAAERPSPPEDTQARMAIQVELMNASRGKAQLPDRKTLVVRWCGVANKAEDTITTALRQRLSEAIRSL